MGSQFINQVKSRIYQLDIALQPDPLTGWQPYHLFRGRTKSLNDLSCHMSVLQKGVSPHPPHAHAEEEILLVLYGEVDILLLTDDSSTVERIRLTAEQFVYYPADFSHSLETMSNEPARYVMIKWTAEKKTKKTEVTFGVFSQEHCFQTDKISGNDSFKQRLFFQGKTSFLSHFRCHLSTLAHRAGYEPHADDYDVVIFLMEGHLETLGEKVHAPGVVFYAEGDPHGMCNPGKESARYLVFEMNGVAVLPKINIFVKICFYLKKIVDPQRWKRKIKKILGFE